jgi:hypothetical protein
MVIMPRQTEWLLRKAFVNAVGELDLADSERQSAAHLKMVNARLAFVDHKAGCSVCCALRQERERPQ